MGGGGTKNDPLDCGFLSEYFGEQIALKTATETSCFGVNLMGCRLLLLQVLSRHSWKEPLMTASSMNASVMAVAMLIWSAWHSVGRGGKPHLELDTKKINWLQYMECRYSLCRWQIPLDNQI